VTGRDASIKWTEPAPGARLARADWLDAASSLEPESIDLCYADPPFATGRTHRGGAGAYPDRWTDLGAYLRWLRERLVATIPALTPSGALMLHLDWRTSHHVRTLLDQLVGPECFVNHLIWSYGLGGSSPRRFARKHDDILFYARTPDGHWFEPPLIPATSRRMAGQMKKATDVLDIPALNNMAAERTGYPTQKPLALLETLVGAACPPGGAVFDPCCGSGTTLVASARLGRRAIGCDVSEDAIELTARRLTGAYELPERIASSPAGKG
jgi:DNA modification methylase